ncbi:MAG: hypothetical protein ACYDBQ_09420 [Thermoplasmatota archaeon]
MSRPARPGRAWASDTVAITPALGTILVLAITVVGIAGILAWGAPTIDRIQGSNALAQVAGQFEDLRNDERDLSVPDHSRFPTIDLPGGIVSVIPGTRFLVTSDHDSSNLNCDFHVTNWSDSTSKAQVTIAAPNCRTIDATCPAAVNHACVEVFSVTGTTTVQQAVTGTGSACNASCTATVTGADTSQGDWLFRISNGNTLNPVVWAEAWLHSSDRLDWSMTTSTGKREAMLDGGSVYTMDQGSLFLDKAAVIEDTAFGAGYYGFWLRAITAGNNYTSISGQGTHQIYFSLMSNAVRVDATNATRLRYDFFSATGRVAQAWCNTLLARNGLASNNLYNNDANLSCTSGNANGERSVCYIKAASNLNACTSAATTPFQFRFMHARIFTGLSV